MDYQDLLTKEFYNNTVKEYLQALAIFIAFLVVFRVSRHFIFSKAKALAARTVTQLDNRIVDALESVNPLFYDFVALYIAFHKLYFPEAFHHILNKVFFTFVIIQIIFASQKIIEYFIHRLFSRRKKKNANYQTLFSGLSLFVRLILWTIGVLLILSNLGINVTSLTTSLGIGGIAVALAVQNILGDIFSSFSIYFDKPFEVEDFIVIGEQRGTVKKIGLKTTRIESLDGEEVIISNKELTSSRIQNFKRMQKRRILFTLGVVYSTSLEQCKLIPKIISKIFKEIDNADLDRVNFLEFAASSLNFEIVYFHLSGDYNEYMRVREIVNLRIKEEFQKADIEFAFPTQTLIVKKE